MRTILFTIMLLATGIFTFGQLHEDHADNNHDDEFRTILGNNAVGGYGGISIQYSVIDDNNSIVIGGRGGVILGHVFAVGFGGSGFINEYNYDVRTGLDYNLTGGYGGVFFEPIIAPNYPVHVSFPILMGAGGIAYTTIDRDYNDYQYWVEDSEAFIIAEPGAEIELNITRFFRFALFGSYRITNNFNIYTINNINLNGFSGGITLKFGKF